MRATLGGMNGPVWKQFRDYVAWLCVVRKNLFFYRWCLSMASVPSAVPTPKDPSVNQIIKLQGGSFKVEASENPITFNRIVRSTNDIPRWKRHSKTILPWNSTHQKNALKLYSFTLIITSQLWKPNVRFVRKIKLKVLPVISLFLYFKNDYKKEFSTVMYYNIIINIK